KQVGATLDDTRPRLLGAQLRTLRQRALLGGESRGLSECESQPLRRRWLLGGDVAWRDGRSRGDDRERGPGADERSLDRVHCVDAFNAPGASAGDERMAWR